MARAIHVGDTVGYRVRFLRSVGLLRGEAPQARGIVTAISNEGQPSAIATIDWDRAMPPRVLLSNLARPGTLAFTSEDR